MSKDSQVAGSWVWKHINPYNDAIHKHVQIRQKTVYHAWVRACLHVCVCVCVQCMWGAIHVYSSVGLSDSME